MKGNQTWYNRAWLYSDRYIGDNDWKQEFLWIRKELGRLPKIKPLKVK